MSNGRAARASRRVIPLHTTSDELHEECGVVGIYAPGQGAARLAFFSLYTLQHRGQEAAGIVTCNDGVAHESSEFSGRVSGAAPTGQPDFAMLSVAMGELRSLLN